MFLRINRAFKKSRSEDGFTLLELLAVIVLIGILAAIAVPVFINAQNAAHDASVKSDARNTVIGVASALVTKPDATGFSVLAAGDTVAASVKLMGVPTVAVVVPTGAVAVRAVVTQSNWVTVRGTGADYVVHAQSTIDGFWYEFSSKTGKYTSSTDNPPVTPKVPSSKDPVVNSVKNPDGTPIRVPGDPVTTTDGTGGGSTPGGGGGTGGPATGASATISASDFGLYYLKPDGQLYAYNTFSGTGLADGTDFPLTISPVSSGTRFSVISPGFYHTLALDQAGKLWTWGDTRYGALGGAPVNTTTFPLENQRDARVITPENTYKAIAGGYYASYAIDTNGHLWTWGLDTQGQLGGGSFVVSGSGYSASLERNTPEMVTPDVTYTAVSAGDRYAMALDSNGHIWTFGDNGYGRGANKDCYWRYGETPVCHDPDSWAVLPSTDADGTPTTPPTPLMVTPDRTYKSMDAAGYHSMAIDTDGHMWIWGSGSSGEIGDGAATDRYPPTLITPTRTYKEVSGDTSAASSMAIDTSGHLWSWGDNSYESVGDGTATQRNVPTLITPDKTYAHIAAGTYGQNFALGTDGKLYGWGRDVNTRGGYQFNDYSIPNEMPIP